MTTTQSDAVEPAQAPEQLPAKAVAAILASAILATLALLQVNVSRSTAFSLFSQPSGTVPALVFVAAIALSLALVRHWPWLLLAGTGLNLALVLAPGVRSPLDFAQTFGAGAVMPLVTIGVLAAVQHLIRHGRTVPGVLLGAGVFGLMVLDFDLGLFIYPSQARGGSAATSTGPLPLAEPVLAVVALVGGVVAVAAWVGRLPVHGDSRPGDLGRWRGVIVGVLAAAVPAAAWAIFFGLVNQSNEVSAVDLVILTGGPHLLAAVALSVVAGRRVLLWTAVAALTMVGTSLPLSVSSQVAQNTGQSLLAGLLGGLAAGAMLAVVRFRAVLAAGGCVAVALGIMLLHDAVAGDPASLQRNAERVPNLGFIAVVVATLALVGGTAVVSLARRRAVPVALLPLASLFALGGDRARALYMLTDEQSRGGVTSDLVGSNVLTANVALGAAAALLLGVAGATFVRARRTVAQQESDQE